MADEIAQVQSIGDILQQQFEKVEPKVEIEEKEKPAVETAATEVKPTIEEKPVVETKAEPTAAAKESYDWRKADLKKDFDAILKESFGLSDDMIKLIKHQQSTGDISDYFKAYNTDYDKITPQELIKIKIDATVGLSEEEKADILADTMEKYKLDPEQYTEEEIRRSMARMKADTMPDRLALKAKQAELLVSKTDPIAEINAKAEAEEKQRVENAKAFEKELLADDYTKSMFDKKSITLGKGKDSFKMDVDPQLAVDILTGKVDSAQFLTKGGKADFQANVITALFMSNPETFISKLIDHGKKLGTSAVVDEAENLQKVDGASQLAEIEEDHAMLLAMGGKQRRN